MERIVLVIHLMVAAALVAVVLMQKSEGGALGIGGGGMSNFMTGRGTANVLTRATALLAACFMLTSLVLVILPQLGGHRPSVLPQPLPVQQQMPAVPTAPLGSTSPGSTSSGSTGQAPAGQAPAAPQPATPSAPTVPLGQ
jgi:preprotein translocase subunit SecG